MQMAEQWTENPGIGWQGESHVDWFFDGGSNLHEMAGNVAKEILELRGRRDE